MGGGGAIVYRALMENNRGLLTISIFWAVFVQSPCAYGKISLSRKQYFRAERI